MRSRAFTGSRQFLFSLAMILYIVQTTVYRSFIRYHLPYGPFETGVRMICLLLLLGTWRKKLFFRSKKRLAVVAVFLCFLLATAVLGDYGNQLIPIMLVIFAIDIDLDRLLRVVETTLIVCVAAVILSSLAGILPNLKYRRLGNTRTANTFGYTYYTTPSGHIFLILLIHLYLHRKKAGILRLAAIMLVSVLSYYLFTARIYLISMTGVVTLYVLTDKLRVLRYQGRAWKVLIPAVFPVLSAVSIAVPFFYQANLNSPFARAMNLLFSSRLRYMVSAYRQQGFSLFVRHISMQGNAYGSVKTPDGFYIDNGYYYAFFAYGILFFAVLTVTYVCLSSYVVKNCNPFMISWLVIGLVMSVSYNYLLSPIFIPHILLIPQMIRQSSGAREPVKGPPPAALGGGRIRAAEERAL